VLRLQDNPPSLFPLDCQIADIPGPWRVAHTKSRNEKALSWQLLKWDIPYFLPMKNKVYSRKGRKFSSLLPLFAGYVFFAGDDDQRYKALTTNKIAQIIEVSDQPGFIREITQIHRAVSSGLPVDNHPYLKAGMLCRVTGGPLMGMEGYIERRKTISRLILQINILGQSASVEIDNDLLEPLE